MIRQTTAGFAPGNYECWCLSCSAAFTGDKRAFQCLPCAADTVAATRSSAKQVAVKAPGMPSELTEEEVG